MNTEITIYKDINLERKVFNNREKMDYVSTMHTNFGFLPLDLEKDKYTNFKNIKTRVYSELSDLSIQQFLHFIKLTNGSHLFIPKLDNIKPYFSGHNSKIFVTFYNGRVHICTHKTKTLHEHFLYLINKFIK